MENKPTNIGISLYCQKNFLEKEAPNHYGMYFAPQMAIDMLGELIKQDVLLKWDNRKSGYRDGVVLVPIDPKSQSFTCPITCPVVELKDGMVLTGKFSPRVPGEEPRKKVSVPNIKGSPANFVDVVLYRKDVLDETHENSGDFDWEIITVLPKLHEEQPMPPDTLIYNHFQLSGGTSTKMTDSEFVNELKKSFVYWKDKAMVD